MNSQDTWWFIKEKMNGIFATDFHSIFQIKYAHKKYTR